MLQASDRMMISTAKCVLIVEGFIANEIVANRGDPPLTG